MKKVLFVAFMVMAFMAMASMAAFACGGDKAEKASAKSASACSADKTTEAKLASSKTTGDKAACTAAEKAACASKASMVNAEGKAACTAAEKAACASKASMVNAEGKSCSVAMCLEKSAVAHAELCGEKAASHHLTAMSIKGMTCGGCESSVKTALMAVEGVTNVVDVCHKAGFAVVCTDKVDFNNQVLVKTVSAKGYESEIIPAVAVTTTDSKSDKAECAAKKSEGSN